MSNFHKLNQRMHEFLKGMGHQIERSAILKEGDLNWIQDGKFPRLSVMGFAEDEEKKEHLPLISTEPKPLKEISNLKDYFTYQGTIETLVKDRNADDSISTIESICFVPKLDKEVLFYLYAENIKSNNLYALDIIIEGQLMKSSPIVEIKSRIGIGEKYFTVTNQNNYNTFEAAHTGHLILIGRPVKNMVSITHSSSHPELKKSPGQDKGKIAAVNIGISNRTLKEIEWVTTKPDYSRKPFLRHLYLVTYSLPEAAEHIILNADFFLHMFPKNFYNNS